MDYSVVQFSSDCTFSEIPTHWLILDENKEIKSAKKCWWPPTSVKNTTSYISKGIIPDTDKWQQESIVVTSTSETLEGARKRAADSDYTSADENSLGRGRRKKKRSRIITESSDEDDDEKTIIVKKPKKELKLPPWPTESPTEASQPKVISNEQVSESQQQLTDMAIKAIQIQKKLLVEKDTNVQESRTSTENIDLKQLKQQLDRIEAKQDFTFQKVTVIDMGVRDVIQRMEGSSRAATNSEESFDRVKELIPLQTIQKIKEFDEHLKDKNFSNKFKNYISSIGGKDHNENTTRILAKVFTDKVAMQCSWKGLRKNFPVEKLKSIEIMKDVIIQAHGTIKEDRFEKICLQWFIFGKQRYTREAARSQEQ